MASPRSKISPYLLLLVVTFALVGLIGYQTLKGRKISADLLKEKDSAIEMLHQRLQKENKKASDLQEKVGKLLSQKNKLDGVKEGLNGQIIELEHMRSSTEDQKKKLESSLEVKENEISDLKAKLTLFQKKEEELKLMKDEITQKDVEIEDLKAQLRTVQGLASAGHSNDSNSESLIPRADAAAKGEHEGEVSNDEGSSAEKEGNFTQKKRATAETKEDKEKLKGEFTANIEEESEEKDDVSNTKMSVLQSTENDEDSRVDEREEILSNEDTGEEGEAEKVHEEEETDEQPDVDIEAVSKADLEENDMASME